MKVHWYLYFKGQETYFPFCKTSMAEAGNGVALFWNLAPFFPVTNMHPKNMKNLDMHERPDYLFIYLFAFKL